MLFFDDIHVCENLNHCTGRWCFPANIHCYGFIYYI